MDAAVNTLTPETYMRLDGPTQKALATYLVGHGVDIHTVRSLTYEPAGGCGTRGGQSLLVVEQLVRWYENGDIQTTTDRRDVLTQRVRLRGVGVPPGWLTGWPV